MTVAVIRADARSLPLPDGSVDLICTSPPYWGLRDYRDGDASLAGQIGSEATPAQYVAALVECTREWVRVLKPSGSMFINLGDGYASGNQRARAADYAGVTGRGVHRPGAASEWTNANAAWLAAVLDCEGSVSGRIFTNSGGGESFVTWMRVGMMDREVVEQIYEITGVGRVFQDGRGVWNYHVASQAARYVLERIWPWLRIKQKRALAAIELCRHVEDRAARGRRTLTSDDLAYRAMLVGAIRDWNGHPARPNGYVPPVPPKVYLPDRIDVTPAKSLRGLPWRYALACMDDLGLILRRDIVWEKLNSLPESVTDRCRSSHEYLFHFVKQPRYYSAIDEIREPHVRASYGRISTGMSFDAIKNGVRRDDPSHLDGNPLGKLPSSVWHIEDIWPIPSQPLAVPDALGISHFAAFPMELPRRVIAGWSPPGICTACGEGRRPVVDRHNRPLQRVYNGTLTRVPGDGREDYRRGVPQVTEAAITGYACACPQPGAPTRPARVADPFGGTGTTALVADALGRDGLSFDRSAGYCRLARWRTTDPGERAKALQVPKPPPVMDGQDALFAL